MGTVMPEDHKSTTNHEGGDNPTQAIAAWIAGVGSDEFGERPRRWAKHALLDWLGVTLAGSRDPLVDILVSDAIAEGETGRARLIGREECVTPSFAAMINGAASHALDFDDVNKRLHGHPTVPVVPALLCVAEQKTMSGRAVLDAFIIGYEVECLIGEMMGLAHYDHGWHATATIGTFGAAAGSARLLGLDADQTAMALGIAATQAAGLKSMFGTMCKPLHAGKAAMNGLMAARWAAKDFISRADALECAQGFGLTQSTEFKALPIRADADAPFAIEENLFKYHAACYLTHSSIEAIRSLKTQHGFTADDVHRVRTRVDAGHRQVCDILEPATGLEVKFSIRHCIAMAISGDDTGAMEIYTDDLAMRPDLMALRRKVDVEDKIHENRHAAEVIIDLADGRSLVETFDAGVPADDLDAQEARLVAKFKRLAEPVIGRNRAALTVDHVMALNDAEDFMALMAEMH
jgi:2-methylcitrate dehydratase PrpD